MVAYNEHKMKFLHASNHKGMSQMFNGRECEVRSVTGRNVHKNYGDRTQEGGTSRLLFGTLIQQHTFKASGKDKSGLGRLISKVLRGSHGILPRFVCRYNPCASSKNATRSSYQQQRSHLITNT